MKLCIIKNKILNLLYPNKEKQRRKEILKDIKKAKQIFLEEQMCFMCHCFRRVNPKKYDNVIEIRKIIPEFKPTTFTKGFNPNNYFNAWWSITDRKSRIKAFDKLIEIYSK